MRPFKGGFVLAVLVLLTLCLFGTVQAEDAKVDAMANPAEDSETPSAANAAAMANLPAVWHEGPVTQLAIGSRLDQGKGDDVALALAISQQLNDRVLLRGAISHALQKEQTVAAATLILKW